MNEVYAGVLYMASRSQKSEDSKKVGDQKVLV